MIDLKKELNAEQYAAVVAPDGPLLVLAAAGTGKTRTLVYRAVHLMSRGYKPYEILLLTFTNRAANEMLKRVGQLCGMEPSAFCGGTFHHIANIMLRKFGDRLGYDPSFAILDKEDQKTLLGHVMNDMDIKKKEFTSRDLILSAIGGAVSRGMSLENFISSCHDSFRENDIPGIIKISKEYAKRKRASNSMDFDDLLTNALKLLKDDAYVRNFYQNRFRHVLVDEFQDTNVLQCRMIDIIAGGHKNVTVVGDDFQCIYSWRGSDFRNIMEFPKRYPNARIIKLERNYRSTPEILSVANKSICNNHEQFEKTLRPVRGNGVIPEVHRVYSDSEQAHKIHDIIKTCLLSGYKGRDIAVLYRAHFHAIAIQTTLAKFGMPYKIVSGPGFYEQAHVKDLISFFKIVEVPGDFFAFSRMVELFPGVGEATASKMWNVLSGSLFMTDKKSRELLLSVMPSKARPVWSEIEQQLGEYAESQKGTGKSERIFLKRLLDIFYRDYMKGAYGDGRDRENDLYEVINAIESRGDLNDFLSDVALQTNLDRKGGDSSANPEDMVTLCTVHQAKGLEWSVVIIPWLVEGMFPSSKALEESDDSEERRLFYVAVTRARERLFMMSPKFKRAADTGYPVECAESRFLREVPSDLYNDISEPQFDFAIGGRCGGRSWYPSQSNPRFSYSGGSWKEYNRRRGV